MGNVGPPVRTKTKRKRARVWWDSYINWALGEFPPAHGP